MLAGSAEGGISSVAPQGVRRGLYMDLLNGSNLSASSTALRPEDPPWAQPRRFSLHDHLGLESEDGGGSVAGGGYERPVAAPKLAIKGVRSVNIMETLSQLAGGGERRLLKSTLPATPMAAPSPSRGGRTRGRTPDWIKKIFDHAKRGQLDQLRNSLRDMEATLVRNLSDHHGNNLLHVVACQGHEAALAWLCSFLQAAHLQLDGALADENRSGLTPAACAVKYGHSNCVEWLVSNTRLREKLASKDGERCLLHVAAKYNQDSVLQWLVNAMKARQIGLDQRDHCGDTPLHLAARTGHLDTCRILLCAGSNVSAKNDLGLKASDMALASGHASVQHYLNLFEASLCVAGDLAVVQNNFEALRAENSELKGYFRDVLGIGKRLAKERDEMCREAVGRTLKGGAAAHEAASMALTQLQEENRALRQQLGIQEATESEEAAVVAAVHALAQPPTGQWKGLVVSGLADMEHRLLVAEEAWRKLSFHSNTDRMPVTVDKSPADVLKHQVEQVEEQQRAVARAGLRAGAGRSLSSSESSLDTLLSLQTGATGDNIYSQLIDPVSSPVPTALATPASSGTPASGGGTVSRQELRRRLQELALTSESGNASVLEVIEPTTSESEAEDAASSTFGQPFRPTSNSSPRLKAALSLDDELAECVVRERPVNVRRCASVQDLLDAAPGRVQPDLLIGTASGDDAALVPDTVRAKKRTFLQKIGFKRRPAARPGLVHKMSPDDFKETYLSRLSDAPSEPEEVVVCPSEPDSASGGVRTEEPPPPVRPPPTSRLVTGHLQHLEAMSVTTSEDSGIVARPCSSASKSDSLLSTSSRGFSLRMSLATDGRVSPAASDLSTARLLTKIEEMRLCEDEPDAKMPPSRLKLPSSAELHKRLTPEAAEKKVVPTEPKSASGEKGSGGGGEGCAGRKRSERAWYDLSDEEPDLLSSAARLSRKAAVRSSSDEEVTCP